MNGPMTNIRRLALLDAQGREVLLSGPITPLDIAAKREVVFPPAPDGAIVYAVGWSGGGESEIILDISKPMRLAPGC